MRTKGREQGRFVALSGFRKMAGPPGGRYEVLILDGNGKPVSPLCERYRLRKRLGQSGTRRTYLNFLQPFFAYLLSRGYAWNAAPSQVRSYVKAFLPIEAALVRYVRSERAKLDPHGRKRLSQLDDTDPIFLTRRRTKQSAGRLLSAYREALSHAETGRVKLPLPFSYEEEQVAVNRNARTVAEVQLEKHSVTLRFLLWDRRSWVKKHPDDYQSALKRRADLGIEEFAEPQFFIECLNPSEELL